MTHAKHTSMVIIALYQNDVLFGDKNTIYDDKMHNFKDILHLSSVLSGSKFCEAF